jgi:Magnesium chelatase, subunit ChlI
VGTSRLARRLTTILPEMSVAEALETTRIHSVAGLTDGRTALVTRRPCRAPHHTISDVGLIGGGQIPLPGEVSLAHHGVLFLDELPEFRRHVLAGLRQPLEDGVAEALCRGRPGSLSVGGLRRTHDGCRESRESPVAAPHHRSSPDARAVPTSPRHHVSRGVSCFSLDTRAALDY